MPTPQEAAREQADIARDLAADGAPALLRYNRAWRLGGRSPATPNWVDLPVNVLITEVKSSLVDRGQVRLGDLAVYVAQADVAQLDEEADLPAAGLAGAAFELLLGADPGAGTPVPGEAGERRFRLLEVLGVTYIGGWPVLHQVLARGA